MKNYTNSDYALNKYSAGIVYRLADGIKEVTLSSYLAETPGKSESDFRALKALSDEIYHEQVKAENAQTSKNTLLEEADVCAIYYAPSPEDIIVSEIDAQEAAEIRENEVDTMDRALAALTETQRRRFLLYHGGRLTARKIATLEGVSHQSVVECLTAAEKKIKKITGNK